MLIMLLKRCLSFDKRLTCHNGILENLISGGLGTEPPTDH